MFLALKHFVIIMKWCAARERENERAAMWFGQALLCRLKFSHRCKLVLSECKSDKQPSTHTHTHCILVVLSCVCKKKQTTSVRCMQHVYTFNNDKDFTKKKNLSLSLSLLADSYKSGNRITWMRWEKRRRENQSASYCFRTEKRVAYVCETNDLTSKENIVVPTIKHFKSTHNHYPLHHMWIFLLFLHTHIHSLIVSFGS